MTFCANDLGVPSRYGKGKLKSFIYAHKLDCCWSAYALFFRREVIKCVTEEVCWLHFLVIVLTALLLSACSNNNKENKLSELEDIKLNQYMTDSGITIPESVDMDTIRSIIIELEDNPEHPAPIVGDTLIADLYEDIRNLVVEYEADKK